MQLSQDQQKLAAENFNLVFAFMNKYNLDAEEYTDILSIGLCEAAGTYDSNTAKFTTYAFRCMKNRMLRHQNKQRKLSVIPQHLLISIEDAVTDDENVTLGDTIADDIAESHITGQIHSEEIMNMLTPKEQEIVNYLDKGFTLEEIGDIYGVSKQCICNRRNAIRKKISSYLLLN